MVAIVLGIYSIANDIHAGRPPPMVHAPGVMAKEVPKALAEGKNYDGRRRR